MIERKHTIMLIKNSNGEYLNYYDKRWNCYLFLNTKIFNEFDENESREYLHNILGLNRQKIKFKLLFEKVHTKFSESAKIEKKYHHYFYELDTLLPSYTKAKEFNYNDINYKWFSIKELEDDERIQKVNGDIVSMIKEYYNE